MLKAITDVPIYMATLFLLYWGSTIAGFLHKVEFLNFTKPRGDLARWTIMMVKFFRLESYVTGSERLNKNGKCIYLCNHRAWSDFFVEHHLTGARCAALSRSLVFAALPVFMMYGYVSRSMFFFNRNAIHDKEKFNEWIDKSIDASPFKGLIVYPEGHRNLTEKSLPLKKGMLRYAYSRRVPCQIVIGKNKERVFSEKEWRVRFGAKIFAGYSRVFNPGDYEEFEDFLKAIQIEWDRLWEAVFSIKDQAGLQPLEWTEIERQDFPLPVRINCAWVMIVGMFLFIVTLACMSYSVVKILRFVRSLCL